MKIFKLVPVLLGIAMLSGAPILLCAGEPARQLTMEIEFPNRTYFLGEPLWIRCSLVNKSTQAVAIPYYRYGEKNSFFVELVTADSTPVKRVELLRNPVIIMAKILKPGERFTELFELYGLFEISSVGRYSLRATFQSDGEYQEFDRKTKERVTKHGWKGSVNAEGGNFEIVKPNQQADAAALDVLLEKNPYSDFLTNPRKRATLIEKHPDSRYTAYAHYYEALEELHRYRDSKGDVFAKRAHDHLAKIDESKCDALFHELVSYARIQALAGMGEKAKAQKAFEDFKKKFPKTPYAFPADY
jgi:hypothetical protein